VAGNDSGFAWYQILTTTPYDQQGGGGNEDFTNLIWADEFDINGAPNPENWGFDIGTGNNGWGNAEAQYYTNNANNVIVQDGKLIITARAESLSGSNYTSARIKSENKFDFKYGKIEVRAKLPSGGGTWPAIWMLGANFSEVGWPQCGEIDIMEHRGNQQDVIHGALHYPGNSAGNANTNSTNVPNVSNEFHTYSIVWTENSIRFFVDDQQFHTFANNGSVPFNQEFFIILNVAMGGTFGGAIDPNFTQSSMEIDYVRVYQ
jgi:beta-glucanase (GH16 family)